MDFSELSHKGNSNNPFLISTFKAWIENETGICIVHLGALGFPIKYLKTG